MKIVTYTSGSTGEPKRVEHDEHDFFHPAKYLVEQWQLDRSDVILNPFPSWTIAHWAFGYFPAKVADCEMISIHFEPLKFWKQVKEIKPTTLTLAIGTMHTMLKRGSPNLTEMKNLSTGSAPVTKHQMNMMRSTGAQNCWNIYGSTECIPPVMMVQGLEFDMNESPYNLEYKESLIVDGFDTQDIFVDNQCQGREITNKTWKS